jgi:hypothetical protein
MSERIKIKKKWIFLLCLAAPLLSFVFISPEWLARLVAVNGVSLVLIVLLFNYGLNPRSRILGTGGYARVHEHSERRDRVMTFIGRCLIIILGICGLYFCIKPLIYDDVQFVRQGSAYAEHIEGRVRHNDTMFGLYFLSQGLLVGEDGQQMGNSHAAFLFRRIAHQGQMYSFIVAPKTGLILDFEEISSTTNSINNPM